MNFAFDHHTMAVELTEDELDIIRSGLRFVCESDYGDEPDFWATHESVYAKMEVCNEPGCAWRATPRYKKLSHAGTTREVWRTVRYCGNQGLDSCSYCLTAIGKEPGPDQKLPCIVKTQDCALEVVLVDGALVLQERKCPGTGRYCATCVQLCSSCCIYVVGPQTSKGILGTVSVAGLAPEHRICLNCRGTTLSDEEFIARNAHMLRRLASRPEYLDIIPLEHGTTRIVHTKRAREAEETPRKRPAY